MNMKFVTALVLLTVQGSVAFAAADVHQLANGAANQQIGEQTGRMEPDCINLPGPRPGPPPPTIRDQGDDSER
jgi:hypothetical protein